MKVIVFLCGMVSRLMVATVDDNCVEDAQKLIKLFLSVFNKMDSMLFGRTENPTWIMLQNFVWLLNFLSVMEEFGSLLNLHERVRARGEGRF